MSVLNWKLFAEVSNLIGDLFQDLRIFRIQHDRVHHSNNLLHLRFSHASGCNCRTADPDAAGHIRSFRITGNDVAVVKPLERKSTSSR